MSLGCYPAVFVFVPDIIIVLIKLNFLKFLSQISTLQNLIQGSLLGVGVRKNETKFFSQK